MTIGMCPCVLLAANGMVCYWLTFCQFWCASMQILCNCGNNCSTAGCTIISLHPPYYDITRCGFLSTTSCLSDDALPLIVYPCN